ncbi:hypothetical protein [Clostridium paridis]|uniref:Uncharacterized protein n=1 Tax=Clostridium paridis TaxID=2803863 RepID=A0A937K6L3_9CLOT|nr:hypothetical protein [Clostridium paridis]MBL4933990.1 hypothetical protein [Clostridium paridis]
MNFVEEVEKFQLIKGSDAYEMAKLEVLLRLEKVYIATRGGNIAVFPSNMNRTKSVYVYTNREFINDDGNNYDEISLEKFNIILKNKGNNFNNCFINNNTEFSIILAGNIPYFIRRYDDIYSKSVNFDVNFSNTVSVQPNANPQTSVGTQTYNMDNNIQNSKNILPDRIYLVARDAADLNNIDYYIRTSSNDNYAYLYYSSAQGNNNVFKEQLYWAKLVGISKNHFIETIMPDLKQKGINKIILNFGTKDGTIVEINDII